MNLSPDGRWIFSGNLFAIRRDLMSNRDSEIKARYALTVLRIARSADRETAFRLVQGLARDFPLPDERREIAGLHFDAITAFEKLGEELRTSAKAPTWAAATSSAAKWLSVVSHFGVDDD